MQKVNCNIMVKATFSISIEEDLKAELDKEIAKGRLGANRSQAIEYCIKQVLQLEKNGSRDIEFVIKFVEIIKERPDIEKRLREFYEDRLKEQRK